MIQMNQNYDNRIQAILTKQSWKVGLDKINKEQLWKKAFEKKLNKTNSILNNIKFEEIIVHNKIDISKLIPYFDSVLKIHNGVQIKCIKEQADVYFIELKLYGALSKNDSKNTSPKYLELNEDLLWFMGLWFGDRCGRSTMIGISSKELSIIEKIYNIFSNTFKQNKDKITVTLEYNEENKNSYEDIRNKFSHITINRRNDNLKPWVGYKIKFNNAFLRFIFSLIERRLEEFLNLLDKKQLSAFLAGFFDAEGTVYRRNIYYTQKTHKELIQIIRGNLSKLNIETDYKNKTIYIKNSLKLAQMIYSFIYIEEKKLRMKSLLEHGIAISSDDVFILWLIDKLGPITSTALSKILNKSKVRTSVALLALYENNMILRSRSNDNSPFEVSLTENGKAFLVENEFHLNHIKKYILAYRCYGTGNKFKMTEYIGRLMKVN